MIYQLLHKDGVNKNVF